MTREYIHKWILPDSYGGAHWDDYYVFLGRSRDSSILEQSNFECSLMALGGESDTVLIVREGHWACGWVEWIAIHQSDDKALDIAEEIVCALSDYPVLDESDYSEKCCEAGDAYWESMSIRERVEVCRDNNVSIFAARRDYIPNNNGGIDYYCCEG